MSVLANLDKILVLKTIYTSPKDYTSNLPIGTEINIGSE